MLMQKRNWGTCSSYIPCALSGSVELQISVFILVQNLVTGRYSCAEVDLWNLKNQSSFFLVIAVGVIYMKQIHDFPIGCS